MDTIAFTSTQKQRDHNLAELFLKTYKQGHYAAHLDWIKNSRCKDVEVVGWTTAGKRLAVEHTVIENFPSVWEKERFIHKASQPLLGDASLLVPGRIIWIWLPAEIFDRSRPWTWKALGAALVSWARSSFATLPAGDSTQSCNVPAESGALLSIEIRTTVREAPGNPGRVSVKGLLPVDSEPVLPALKESLPKKLPKLLKRVDEGRADKGVLLLELHGRLVQPEWVLDQIREDPQVQKLHAVALVYTSGIKLVGEVSFYVWHPSSDEGVLSWNVSLAV